MNRLPNLSSMSVLVLMSRQSEVYVPAAGPRLGRILAI